MLSVNRDTIDSISTLSDDWSRCGSDHSNSTLLLPYRSSARGSDLNTTALSPPPPPPGSPQTKPAKTHLRLRSDSGLALHTNKAAFRQYTDYHSDGSLRTPSIKKRPLSFDSASNVESSSLGTSIHVDFASPPQQTKPIPRFFDHDTIHAAFAHPITGQRLVQFAKGTHSAADLEFLFKVNEYTRALGNMASLIGQISEEFTSLSAATPLELPPDMLSLLRANTKTCARLALPQLERLYRDAKVLVEDRLNKTLYPEFLKHQLSQRMRSSLSVSRSLTGGFQSAYPGLGDAFCLTDPLEPDNPIVYASDGLLKMTGYERREMINRNCRVLQGVSTDPEAAHRIREAVLMGRETTELILNYRKDGSPFWNLLFMCPLMEQGSVRYCLGGQINVSESMGTEHKDILRILNFRLPGEDFPAAPVVNSPERPVRKSPSNPKIGGGSETSALHDVRQRPYRRPFFRRFSKKSKAARQSQTVPPTANGTEGTPLPKRRAYSPQLPRLEQQINGFSTPYSRFFVMRYIPRPTTTTTAASTGSSSSGVNVPHIHMPVAFCSSFALELLGIKSVSSSSDIINTTTTTTQMSTNSTQETDGTALEQVLHKDIFSVLAEHAHSTSVNRSFRSTVLEKVAAGQAVSVDLLTNIDVPATTATTPQQPSTSSSSVHKECQSTTGAGPARNPLGTKATGTAAKDDGKLRHAGNGSLIRGAAAMMKKGRRVVNTENGTQGIDGIYGPEGQGRPARLSDTLDRGAEILSNVFFGPKMKKLVSHWAPLKDGQGRVGWVVLVLTGASST